MNSKAWKAIVVVAMILGASITSSATIPHCFLGTLPLSDFLTGVVAFPVSLLDRSFLLATVLILSFSLTWLTGASRLIISSDSEWFVFSYT